MTGFFARTRSARVFAGALVGLSFATFAQADVRIGVILSLTGPGASLGIPAQNTVKLWPAQIGGQKAIVTVLNDETDPTIAAKDAARLLNEEKVDVIPSSAPHCATRWRA